MGGKTNMLFFMIIAVVFVGWCFYKYDRNGFGAPQMRGMTHSAIADYYRRAFLDDDPSMQEVFENHWGDDYGTDKWMQFEMRVLEYLESNGDVQAKERLALVLLDGEQWKNGVERLEKLANEGNPSAMLRLAHFYGMSTEHGGRAYDQGKEISWLQKAANKGNVQALYELGFNYVISDTIAKDEEKAMAYWEEAMNLGHQGAKVQYAMYRYGRIEKDTYDPYKVIDLLKSVLLADDVGAIARASHELGMIYGGSSVFVRDNPSPKSYENVEEALRYFHLAKRIDPDSLSAAYYRSLMINTEFNVDEKMEKQWARLENEILQIRND